MINRNPITKENLNQEVTLKGWVAKSRRLGDLIFVDLRNERGITQIVFDKDNKNIDLANTLRNEYVISVTGTVVERKNPNPELPSGEIEVIASELEIINEAETTPLIIADETDALEPTRLEYRYLDIRRNVLKNNLIARAKVNKIMRDHYESLGFIEVETPTITKPSPGGAGEFKVKSENHKGKSYALTQSPQVYKQLLMYGGIDGYYQIARCYRDEDSRSDRQLEFTQLDLEKSFTTPEEIQGSINDLLAKVVKEVRGVEIDKDIPLMTYTEAMQRFGSDKPDTRFGNELHDLTEILKDTGVNFIKSGIDAAKTVQAIAFQEEITSGRVKKLEEELKQQGASGLAWARIENNEVVKGSLKALASNEVEAISKEFEMDAFTLLMVIDEDLFAKELIGRARLTMANEFGLIDEDKLNFLWITEWPLFEKNSEGKIESAHNPFTSPMDIEEFMAAKTDEELLNVKAEAYDIVLNGSEIGGGSIRISNMEVQNRVFEVLGLSEQDIEDNFGWFLKSMKYGIPQHGGIALGIDRIMAILLKQESIRDVIAFPKSTSGLDEMTKAPVEDK